MSKTASQHDAAAFLITEAIAQHDEGLAAVIDSHLLIDQILDLYPIPTGGGEADLRAALEPFAALARPRHPDEGGSPSWIDIMTNAGECDELELRSHVAMDRHSEILQGEDFRRAATALSTPSQPPGGVETGWLTVPADDPSRPFADSLLPLAMIDAGMEVFDRVHEDVRNYVAGKTIDWDAGMISVAIYRAMTKAGALASPPPAAGPTREGVIAVFDGRNVGLNGTRYALGWDDAVKACRADVLALFNGAGR